MENLFLNQENLINAIEGINWFSVNENGIFRAGATDEECAFIRYSDVVSVVESVKKTPGAILPCKIGDIVWAIRCYKGVLHPQQGIVSEMFFSQDMRLKIVVKNVARGAWGETVFSSYEDAAAAIEAKKNAKNLLALSNNTNKHTNIIPAHHISKQ